MKHNLWLAVLFFPLVSFAGDDLPSTPCKDSNFQRALEKSIAVQDARDAVTLYGHASRRLGFGTRPANEKNSIFQVQKALIGKDPKVLTSWMAGWICHLVTEEPRYGEDLSRSLKRLFPEFADLTYLELFKSWKSERTKADRSRADFQQYSKVYRNQLLKYQVARATFPAVYDENFGFSEMVAHFWLNHFSVDHAKYHVVAHAGDYFETIRRFRSAKFEQLLEAVTMHPAMVVYLDNFSNQPPTFNLNHPREILELHTLGVQPGAGVYTQSDIENLSRIMSYPEITENAANGKVETRFRPLSTNTSVVLGQKYTSGPREFRRILHNLSVHPVTIESLCKKLSQRFLGFASSHRDVVETCAATWKKTDGLLGEVYKAIVSHPKFWSRDLIGTDYKNPLEISISTWRLLGEGPFSADEFKLFYEGMRRSGYLPFSANLPTGFDNDPRAWISGQSLLIPVNVGGHFRDSLEVMKLKVKELPPTLSKQYDVNSHQFLRR